LYVPAGILVASILLSLAFAFHDTLAIGSSMHGQLWSFFLLAYVTFGWDRWHFCAQEFGVLSIYRVRASQTDRADKRFDRFFTVVLMLLVNTILVFCAGYADLRQVVLYGTSLSDYQGEWVEPVALGAFCVGALVTGYALARELRHPKRSLPKLWFYLLVGGHSLALYYFPNALGLFFLSYAFHHWMVSVGLFGRITLHAFEEAPQRPNAWLRSPLARLLLGVAPYLALAVVLYLTCQDLDHAGNLAPLPDLRIFSGASTAAKLVVGVIMGLFFALNYLHYYYDRCFYAFSSPAVRKTVAPLLFRQRASVAQAGE
jgi:hypothetical protein